MSEMITAQDLVNYFEERLQQNDRHYSGTAAKAPYWPLLFVFLGEDAVKGFSEIASNLFQIWPQFRNELCFMSVIETNGEYHYYMLDANYPEEKKQMQMEEVGDYVDTLYGENTHFTDMSKLCVYYILDTGGLRRAEEYTQWEQFIPGFRQCLGVAATDIMDVFILLLEERKQKEANKIRNLLSTFYRPDHPATANSILLLSNVWEDGHKLRDWNNCYSIIAAVAALSDCDDQRNAQTIFRHAIHTVGYAQQKKPTAEIAQVVVTELMNRLSVEGASQKVRIYDSPQLPERLGVQKDGTLEILNQYAEQALIPLLPTEEELEFFPRRTMEDGWRMADMTSGAFNEYTMGAWNCRLNQLVEEVGQKIKVDDQLRRQWKDAYVQMLRKNFSVAEMIDLADHIEVVSHVFEHRDIVTEEARVLDAAALQMKRMLSGNVEIVQIFQETIREQGEGEKAFRQMWEKLQHSLSELFGSKDEMVATFYRERLRTYFDSHGSKILQEFRGIMDTESLKLFLNNTLKKIYDSDMVYGLPFEEELDVRLKHDEMKRDVKQYIRQKLTGENLHRYLQPNFSLGQSVLSAILMRTDTQLYENLKASLNPAIYYYNMSSTNVVEALELYEVSEQNLVCGEEE